MPAQAPVRHPKVRGRYTHPVAIVAHTFIRSADQDAHDRLQAAVEAGIARLGGPPDGLMVHLGYPSGDGFVIVDAWRSEDTFRRWQSEIMEPALAEAGLDAGEPAICPLWSLARP
jgi:hypothetical protein